MRRRTRRGLDRGAAVVAVLCCLVGCASAPPKQQTAPAASNQAASAPHPAQQPAVPLLVAQTVTLKGPVKVTQVHGLSYLMRGETNGEIAHEGEILMDGDLLDLGNLSDNGSVTLHSGANSDITLRRESGRFFRIAIRP